MNIQTIPRKDKIIKAAFIPKLDAFLGCDYSNIELKLLAFYLESVGFPSMADVFREGRDLHYETASSILGKPADQIDDHERQEYGKVPNFSIVYGGGMPTIMEQLSFTAEQALSLLKAYHTKWPGIGWETKRRPADHGTLIWAIKNQIAERTTPTEPGYITTLYGRHLHPRSMHSALNALCQGCGADLLKWALDRIDIGLTEGGFRSHLVNQVHDDIMLDCAADELDALKLLLPEWMTDERIESVIPIRPVPEVSFTTWADMEEVNA